MTLHLRQPLPPADVSELVRSSLRPQGSRQVYRDGLKRILDVTLVLIAAPMVVLVVAVLAVLIARDGGSPFYAQKRLGKDGRVFRMWKLRSMVKDADTLLAEYLTQNPKAKSEWDRTQKLRHDPRITRFGQIIRKTSLDELPQLWNVLIGEMSLVGPRPMMVEQKPLYPGAAYYAMRPGITGFWQTSVRNESSFAERATWDTAYFMDLSFKTDVKVLFRTVAVVMRSTGC